MNQLIYNEINMPKWKNLYKLTGILSIVMSILIPLQIVIFLISPHPETIEGWFEMFHNNWLLGLIHMDLIYIIDNVIVAIIYLSLYFILKERNESLMAVAMLLGFLGLSAYFASNVAFEMLSISSQYYDATAGTDKSTFIAAGHLLISNWKGTAFDVYYVLNAITLLILSFVMLRSKVFSRKTAVIGLVSGIFMSIPSTAGTIGLVFSLLSLIPWILFIILIAGRLRKLCRSYNNNN